MTFLSLRHFFKKCVCQLRFAFQKKRIFQKKKAFKGTAIGISLALTSGVLLAAVGVSSVIVQGSKNIADVDRSNKAYFAAERGVEYSLYDISGHLGGYEVLNENFEDPNAQSYLPESKAVSAWRIQSRIGISGNNTINIPPLVSADIANDGNWKKIPWKGSVSIPLYIDNTVPYVAPTPQAFAPPLLAGSKEPSSFFGVEKSYAVGVDLCSGFGETYISDANLPLDGMYQTRHGGDPNNSNQNCISPLEVSCINTWGGTVPSDIGIDGKNSFTDCFGVFGNEQKCSFIGGGPIIYDYECCNPIVGQDHRSSTPNICEVPISGGKKIYKINPDKTDWETTPALECGAGYQKNQAQTACEVPCPQGERRVGGFCQPNRVADCVEMNGVSFPSDTLGAEVCVISAGAGTGKSTGMLHYNYNTLSWGNPQCYDIDGSITGPLPVSNSTYWTNVGSSKVYYSQSSYEFYENPQLSSGVRACQYDNINHTFSWDGGTPYRFSLHQDLSKSCSITPKNELGQNQPEKILDTLTSDYLYSAIADHNNTNCSAVQKKLYCLQGNIYQGSFDGDLMGTTSAEKHASFASQINANPPQLSITTSPYYGACYKKCSAISPGESESRPGEQKNAFTREAVPFDSPYADQNTCKQDPSIYGTFTCSENGTWTHPSLSSSSLYSACTVLPASKCSDPTGGSAPLNHGEERSVYTSSVVAPNGTCASVTAVCNNGTLTKKGNGASITVGSVFSECHQRCEVSGIRNVGGTTIVLDPVAPNNQKILYKKALLPSDKFCNDPENISTIKCVPSSAGNTSSLSGDYTNFRETVCDKCSPTQIFSPRANNNKGQCFDECGSLKTPYIAGGTVFNFHTDGTLICTDCSLTEYFFNNQCISCGAGKSRDFNNPAACVANQCPFGYKGPTCDDPDPSKITNVYFHISKINGKEFMPTDANIDFRVSSDEKEIPVDIVFPNGILLKTLSSPPAEVSGSSIGKVGGVEMRKYKETLDIEDIPLSGNKSYSYTLKDFSVVPRTFNIIRCGVGTSPNNDSGRCDPSCDNGKIYTAGTPTGSCNSCSLDYLKNITNIQDKRQYQLACCSKQSYRNGLWIGSSTCVPEDKKDECINVGGFLSLVSGGKWKCQVNCGDSVKSILPPAYNGTISAKQSLCPSPTVPTPEPTQAPSVAPSTQVENIKIVVGGTGNKVPEDEVRASFHNGGDIKIVQAPTDKVDEQNVPIDIDPEIREKKANKWMASFPTRTTNNPKSALRSPFVGNPSIGAKIYIRAKNQGIPFANPNTGNLTGSDEDNIIIRWQIVGKLYDNTGKEEGTISLVSNFNKIPTTSSDYPAKYGCGTGANKFMVCLGDFKDAIPSNIGQYEGVTIENLSGKITANTKDDAILTKIQEMNLDDGESHLTTINEFLTEFNVAFPELVIYYEQPLGIGSTTLSDIEYRLEFTGVANDQHLPFTDGTFTVSSLGESNGFQQKLQTSYSPQNLLPIFNYVFFADSSDAP